MQIIFRNFLMTLKRFKLASSLNIIGLSVAFAVFVLILMQVRYEYSFDKFHGNADRIYRVEVSEDGTTYNALVGRKWAELIENRLPHANLLVGVCLIINDRAGDYTDYGDHSELAYHHG